MHSEGRFRAALLGIAVAFLFASPVDADQIGPSDFGPDSTVLSFDTFAHSTFLSAEFECSDGVILGSTAPIGAAFSSDPANSLQPGEAISPFVAAIVSVPSSGTSSPPNKVIATKYGAGGNLLQCERCGITIRFLDPLPTQAGLYVTDSDQGQTVAFSGPSGLLATLTTGPGFGAPEFLGYEDPGGILSVTLRSDPGTGIGFDDLTFAERLAPFCQFTPDEDGDGEPDAGDLCPATPPLAEVDSDGCSLEQFCSSIDATTRRGRRICRRSDWKNDEPLRRRGDCTVDRAGTFRKLSDDRCVAR